MNRKLSALSVLLLTVLATSPARAQTSDEKSEFGAHYTALHLSGFGVTDSGIGARFGFNVNDHLAIEAEGNFFPDTEFSNSRTGQKAQALIGVRAGVRRGKIGVFGKLRPGVIHLGAVSTRIANCVPALPSIVCHKPGGARFMFDAGAVIEFYPTERVIVRVDVGDTIVNFDRDRIFRPGGEVRTLDGLTHNIQIVTGIGFRF